MQLISTRTVTNNTNISREIIMSGYARKNDKAIGIIECRRIPCDDKIIVSDYWTGESFPNTRKGLADATALTTKRNLAFAAKWEKNQCSTVI